MNMLTGYLHISNHSLYQLQQLWRLDEPLQQTHRLMQPKYWRRPTCSSAAVRLVTAVLGAPVVLPCAGGKERLRSGHLACTQFKEFSEG